MTQEPEFEEEELAQMFRALGDPTRLRIFSFLRSQCIPVAVDDSGDVHRADGPTVGEVCCQVTGADKITSTVSVHLKTLSEAGLISIHPNGKFRICSVNADSIRRLSDYLEKAPDMGACCKK